MNTDPNEVIPTITVVRNGGECVINEADFDPATDTVPGAKAAKPAKSGKAKASGELGIMQNGDKFFVVDTGTSEPVEAAGLDVAGYATEADAVAAAQAAIAAKG